MGGGRGGRLLGEEVDAVVGFGEAEVEALFHQPEPEEEVLVGEHVRFQFLALVKGQFVLL